MPRRFESGTDDQKAITAQDQYIACPKILHKIRAFSIFEIESAEIVACDASRELRPPGIVNPQAFALASHRKRGRGMDAQYALHILAGSVEGKMRAQAGQVH